LQESPIGCAIIIHGGITVTDVLLIIITVAVCLVAVIMIPLLVEARKTILLLRKTTEDKLNPALEELQLTLKSLRNVSDTVNDITTDVRTLSQSVGDVGKALGAVNALVLGFSTSAAVKVISLRAGITAALNYLVMNFIRKGERHEG